MHMLTVNIHEAKTHLSRLLDRASLTGYSVHLQTLSHRIKKVAVG